MVDYSKGQIYRIINSDLVQYYGSTTTELNIRFNAHKRGFNSWCKDNTKLYCSSYEVLKGKNVEIELVYECPCSSKEELLKCEQVFIDNDDCVNKRRSFVTIEERKEKQKKYREENRQNFRESQKKYREANLQKTKEFLKKYREENRDKIREYNKKYREAKKTSNF